MDEEHFPEAMTSYVWLSNGKRSKFTALMLVTKTARAGTSNAVSGNHSEKVNLVKSRDIQMQKKKPTMGLIGLGFMVEDVDTWAMRLQKDHRIDYHGAVLDSPGLGRHMRVIDGFGMEIEITEYANPSGTSSKAPTTSMQRRFSGRMLVTTAAAQRRMSRKTGGSATISGLKLSQEKK